MFFNLAFSGSAWGRRRGPAWAAAFCLLAPQFVSGPAVAQLPPAAVADAALGVQIDDYLFRLSGFGYSGAILVARNGEVLLRRGYGIANDEAGISVTADTVFDIGSLAKPFTATAILLLESRGALALSDPISRHLQGVPEDKQNITIEQLLTHTAGLERNFPFVNPTAEDYEEVTREEALRRIFATPLGSPGQYAYSNNGYILLAAIVERASGRPFRDFLRAELFEPVGMRSTGFWGDGLPSVPDQRLARSYDENGETANLRNRSGTTWCDLGGGEMVSTVDDLRAWFDALRQNRILPAESLQRMWAPRVARNGSGTEHYGYGWFIDAPVAGPRRIYHGGDYIGFGSEVAFLPDRNLVTVQLANRQQQGFGTRHIAGQGLNRIIRNLVPRMWRDEAFDMPPRWIAGMSGSVRPPVGTYRLPSGGDLVIRSIGDTLSIAARGQDAVDLLFPGPPEQLAQRRRYNERAIAFIEGAARGDRAVVEAAIREGGDAEGWSRAIASTVRGNDKGRLVSLTALGTIPNITREFNETTIRFQFERGDEYIQVGWNRQQDRITRSREGPAQLAGMQLRASPDAGFVGWSMVSNRAIRVVPLGSDELVGTVRIEHPDGSSVIAHRQSG